MLYWTVVGLLCLGIVGVSAHLWRTRMLPEPDATEAEPTEFDADYDPLAERHAAIAAEKRRANAALGRGHDGVEL